MTPIEALDAIRNAPTKQAAWDIWDKLAEPIRVELRRAAHAVRGQQAEG